jgi:hypothetical protein
LRHQIEQALNLVEPNFVDVGISGSRPSQISGVAKLNASTIDTAERGVPADLELDGRVAESPAPRVLIDVREDATSNLEGEGVIDTSVEVDALLPVEFQAGYAALGGVGCDVSLSTTGLIFVMMSTSHAFW